jgi:hypothetical protein
MPGFSGNARVAQGRDDLINVEKEMRSNPLQFHHCGQGLVG